VPVTAAAAGEIPPLRTPAPATLTEEDRVEYIRALQARDARRFDAAIDGFAAIRARGGPLASLAAMRQGQSLSLAGQAPEAVEAYAVAAADGSLPMPSRVAASLDGAAAATKAGRSDEALALLASVGSELAATATDTAAARWQSARILRERGDGAWAAQALLAVELAPGANSAVPALDALEQASIPVPPLSAAYVRYRARQNEQANALYRAVVHADGYAEDHARAWFYLGALAERFGRDGEAIVYYGYSLESSPAGPLAGEAHWWRGSLLAAHERYAEAIPHFDTITRDFPRSAWADPSALQAALAAARGGARDDGAARLRAVMSERDGKQAAEASRWLSLLGLRGPDDPPPAAFDPWSLAALLDGAGADAVHPLPAGHHGEWDPTPGDWRMADAWMVEQFGPPPADLSGSVLDQPARIALAMAQVGEHEAARAVLQPLARHVAGRPHEALVLARAASDAGVTDVAMNAALSIIGRLPPFERLQTPFAIERLVYPVGFPVEVHSAAQQAGLPPLLLLALVRQESAFQVRAGSTAGAMGLTQVIAPTGQQIATALHESWSPEMLMDPATSLRFGAYYLAQQLRQFDGNVLAALAAYNAGPAAAGRWLREAETPDAEGFIAAVDYNETRLYLERVLENYARYRYVYGATDSPRLR
jgi:soluble lytic murein transglycosylase